MKLIASSSLASKLFGDRVDLGAVLLPIFLGIVRAAPFVPFIAMAFHPSFGISNGHETPNGWFLALASAVGFWAVRLLSRGIEDRRSLDIALLGAGILLWIVWTVSEPAWHFGDIVRRPISIVSGNGHFAWLLVLFFVFWILTLHLALDEREQSPEGVRSIFIRAVAGLFVSVVLASIIGGDIGAAGNRSAFAALPLALIGGIGAIGVSEMVDTRRTARRRGTTMPGWGRWFRSFLGTSGVLVLIIFVAALVFGPGFLQLMVDSLAATWRLIANILLGIVYVLVYGLFWLVTGIAWLLNRFFGADFTPPPPEPLFSEGGAGPMQFQEQEDAGPYKYAHLVRLGGLTAVLILGAMIAFRFVSHRQQVQAADATEERSSVFSGSMLREQLRNLFRRSDEQERSVRVNLDVEPNSVRESMQYLQVLAARLGLPRLRYESALQFTRRLGAAWPELRAPLGELCIRYEQTRYGEQAEDRAAALTAWSEIYAAKLTELNDVEA